MRLNRSWSAVLFLAALIPLACHGAKDENEKLTPKGVAEEQKPHADFLRNEIPPDQLDAVMTAHFEGVGRMERYEYDQAATAFRSVHERAPGWIPGSINLAIARLNQTGYQAEAGKLAKDANGKAPRSNFEEALDLLNDVLKRDPENLHARFCRGIILEYLGEFAQAHPDFLFVAEHDPKDGHAWLKVGTTLSDPQRTRSLARRASAGEGADRALYQSTGVQPLSGHGALQAAEPPTAGPVIGTSRAGAEPTLVAAQPGAECRRAGRHRRDVLRRDGPLRHDHRPVPQAQAPHRSARSPPRFDPAAPLQVTLPEGQRWVKEADFTGPLAVIGRARARFGAGVATFDADGDGRLDLFLTASLLGPKGIRDALLLNRGEGAFEDVTLAWGLPEDHASLGVAAGDFDADRKIDLFLTGVGGNRLLRNVGKRFEDVTQAAGIGGG